MISAPAIVMAIVTYKRPDTLARTLHSLAKLTLPAQTDVRLLIVDNDANQSAKPIIDSVQMPFPVEYAVEEKRGIPHARNKALALAAGSGYLAFIDDDDVADSNWLCALYDAAIHYKAEVVKGQVLYEFSEERKHLAALDIFAPSSAQTGGTLGSAWTNNVLFATSIYKNTDLTFDPRFTDTGGSDHHFFRTAATNGAKIVMCREAIIYSPVATRCMRLGWLIRRHMRTGATLTISDIHAKGYVYAARRVMTALADSAKYAARLLRGAFSRQTPFIHPLMVGFFMLGRLTGLCHISPREYKQRKAKG